MNKPYSFNSRLKRISIIGFCVMFISGFLSLLIGLFSFNSIVNFWISEHTSSTGTTSTTGLIPGQPSLTSIPYSSLLTNNLVLVLVPPIIFLGISFFIIRKVSNFITNNEIFYLYDSVGISHERKHPDGIMKLSDDESLTITQSSSGIFEIKDEHRILSISTGDELYWKKKYLDFIKRKENKH